MTNYLFKDIFYNFRSFFMTFDYKESKYLYKISFGFKPRKFEKHEVIYDEGDDVQEIYFLMNGSVDIGFKHPKDGFVKCKKFHKNSYIGAYNMLSGMKSEFRYEAHEKTIAFSLEKNFFFDVMEKYQEILGRMKSN